MRFTSAVSLCAFAVCAVLCGCATGPSGPPPRIDQAAAPAWSVKGSPPELIVDVSPAGGVLGWAGSTGLVLGAGVDAVVNEKYRKQVEEALGDYDPLTVFQDHLAQRLNEEIPGLRTTSPLGSTAGFQNVRDAQDARYEALGKNGVDMLLDLVMTFGIFGAQGDMGVELDGKLIGIPQGNTLWKGNVQVTREPVLANRKLGEVSRDLGPSTDLALKVDQNAVDAWTADEAARLKAEFEASVQAAVSALLVDLGLAEEALGHYYLGRMAMAGKMYQAADDHFARALERDPAMLDAAGARAVNFANNDQLDHAITMAKAITEYAPDYGPAWFNLAWWYAVEKDDAAAARPCYRRALELGMPRDKKLDEKLGEEIAGA